MRWCAPWRLWSGGRRGREAPRRTEVVACKESSHNPSRTHSHWAQLCPGEPRCPLGCVSLLSLLTQGCVHFKWGALRAWARPGPVLRSAPVGCPAALRKVKAAFPAAFVDFGVCALGVHFLLAGRGCRVTGAPVSWHPGLDGGLAGGLPVCCGACGLQPSQCSFPVHALMLVTGACPASRFCPVSPGGPSLFSGLPCALVCDFGCPLCALRRGQ